jgi:YD repeat-containing protein
VVDVGSFNTNTRLCLDGFWLGPQFNIPIGSGAKMNLCGGRYWGLLDRARDNNNAILFMRTRKTLGLSSFYHTTSNEDFILHYDYFLRTLTIRRGSVEFKEYPMNYEVSIGKPSKRSTASVSASTTTSISLDSTEDKVKSLTINSPNGDEVMLFSVGTTENYYGTVISGNGDMDLIGFDRTSVLEDSSVYKYNDQPVSPIYEYKVGKYSADEAKRVFMGVKTSDSPIIISTPDSSTSISNVEVEYINDNQTINDVELFDIYQISDDELMVFMGRSFKPFRVTNKTSPVDKASNSSAASNKWDNTSGIFVIGSKNTGTLWGNPIAKFRDNDDQYGLLIMESATYCCSIYNIIANEIVILFLGRKDGVLFLGAYIVSVPSFSYENFKCVSEADNQDFIWRPPALEETSDSVYKKQVVDNYKYDPAEEITADELVVVASAASSVNPQIIVTNVTDFGVVSTYQTSDGNMMAFYDSIDGVQMIFSKDSGRTWGGSKIVLAQFGRSGFYSGGLLFYITDEGIYSKIITESLLSRAFSAVEGSSASDIELIQDAFDDQIVTSLETGPIPTQKLSAHNDETGIFHVFYYDEAGRLSSVQGTDLGWKTTKNF